MTNGFPVYDNSKVMQDDYPARVVRYAKRRLERNAVHEITENVHAINTLSHAEIELGERLGHGSFSSVFEIKKVNSKKKYDAKKLVVKVLRSKLAENPPLLAACGADLCKEGLMMASMNHRNIMNIQAWAPSGVSEYMSGRHDGFFLVLDRLDETLSDRLAVWKETNSRINMSLKDRAVRRRELLKGRIDIVMQLSSAVKYMHSKRLLHRDMKPDNIGLQDGVVKVFDFDVSRVVPESTFKGETFTLTMKVGSPRYMAPEIARGKPYNMTADVYTFTVIAHELLTLKKPYDELPDNCHDELVFVEGVRPQIPSSWPKKLQKLFERGWCHKLSIRPSMSQMDESLRSELCCMLQQKETRKNRFAGFTFRKLKTVPIGAAA